MSYSQQPFPQVSLDCLTENFMKAVNSPDRDTEHGQFNIMSALECIVNISCSNAEIKPHFTEPKLFAAFVKELSSSKSLVTIASICEILRNLTMFKHAVNPRCAQAKELLSTKEFIAAFNNGLKVVLENAKIKVDDEKSLDLLGEVSSPDHNISSSFCLRNAFRWLVSVFCCVTTAPNPKAGEFREMVSHDEETVPLLVQLVHAVKNGMVMLRNKDGDKDLFKKERQELLNAISDENKSCPFIYAMQVTPDCLRWIFSCFSNLSHSLNPANVKLVETLLLCSRHHHQQPTKEKDYLRDSSSSSSSFLSSFCFILTHFDVLIPETLQWAMTFVANSTSSFPGRGGTVPGEQIIRSFTDPIFLNTLKHFLKECKNDESFYWFLVVVQRLFTAHPDKVLRFLQSDSELIEEYGKCVQKFRNARHSRFELQYLTKELTLQSLIEMNDYDDDEFDDDDDN